MEAAWFLQTPEWAGKVTMASLTDLQLGVAAQHGRPERLAYAGDPQNVLFRLSDSEPQRHV